MNVFYFYLFFYIISLSYVLIILKFLFNRPIASWSSFHFSPMKTNQSTVIIPLYLWNNLIVFENLCDQSLSKSAFIHFDVIQSSLFIFQHHPDQFVMFYVYILTHIDWVLIYVPMIMKVWDDICCMEEMLG